MKSGISKVVDLIGSQSEVARQLGVKPQAVQQWVDSGVVPPRRCIAVAELVDGKVLLHELNPVTYPDEKKSAPDVTAVGQRPEAA